MQNLYIFLSNLIQFHCVKYDETEQKGLYIDLNTCSRLLCIALTDQICQADGNGWISSGLKGKHAFKPCPLNKELNLYLAKLVLNCNNPLDDPR